MYLIGSNKIQNIYTKPWLWWRYIDDIFDHFYSFHRSTKFTCEYSEKINYIDVQVTVREGKLLTDSHQYLDPSLCHP